MDTHKNLIVWKKGIELVKNIECNNQNDNNINKICQNS
jgi:hypothetical protein